jgi:putative membrane protein
MVSGASLAVPYCGLTAADRWLADWNLDPLVLAAIGIAAILALRAKPALRRQRWAACGLLFVLWVSPLCAASATLLSVRVAHHMMAMLLLAPALALGVPRVRIGDAMTWAILAALALSAWFVPVAYSFAWTWHAGYWLLQLAMLGAAWQFWANWFDPAIEERPLVMAAAPALLAMVMGFVGALLTFAPGPLFAEHIFTTALFGVSPLWDQQLAGLVMWTGGMVPLAALACLRLAKLAGVARESAQC